MFSPRVTSCGRAEPRRPHLYVSPLFMAPAEPPRLTPCCTLPQDKGDTAQANARKARSHVCVAGRNLENHIYIEMDEVRLGPPGAPGGPLFHPLMICTIIVGSCHTWTMTSTTSPRLHRSPSTDDVASTSNHREIMPTW